MVISKNGIDLIKEQEALRLHAYPDKGGVPTIGWGHIKGVSLGMTITEGQADDFLKSDLQETVDEINNSVHISLNQNQFDALCCLVFNIGGGHFYISTLRALLNKGDYLGASLQFARWNEVRNKDTGLLEENEGLTKRREIEKELFLKLDVSFPEKLPPLEGDLNVTEAA